MQMKLPIPLILEYCNNLLFSDIFLHTHIHRYETTLIYLYEFTLLYLPLISDKFVMNLQDMQIQRKPVQHTYINRSCLRDSGQIRLKRIMVLTSVIEVTKCQIKLVSYFIHCPISVNTRANQNSVFSWSPKVRKEMQHLLKLTSLVAYAVFIFLSGLINLDKISYTKDAFVAMISIGVPSCSLLLIFSHRSGNDIVVLLNMLFLYEKRNSICLEVRNLKDLFYYGFWVFGMFGSTIGGPLFVTLLNLVNLNTPPFLGWVIPDVKGKYIYVNGECA